MPFVITIIIWLMAVIILPDYDDSDFYAYASLLGLSIATWTTISASRNQIYKYQLRCVTSAGMAFILCMLFWPVFFTWYLINRDKIKTGRAKLRPEYINDPPPNFVALPADSAMDRYAELRKLVELKTKGILSEYEFKREKAKILVLLLPSSKDRYEQLRKLDEIKAQGILSEDDFRKEKAKIMALAPSPSKDRYAELRKLGELKTQGVLSEEEFQKEKEKVMS